MSGILQHLFKDTAEVRILSALVTHKEEWLEPVDISEYAGVTVDEVIEYFVFLLNQDIIKESDQPKYKLNEENPYAKIAILIEEKMMPEKNERSDQKTINHYMARKEQ